MYWHSTGDERTIFGAGKYTWTEVHRSHSCSIASRSRLTRAPLLMLLGYGVVVSDGIKPIQDQQPPKCIDCGSQMIDSTI